MEIQIDKRIGVGKGFFNVRKIYNEQPDNVWVEIEGKKRVDSKKSFVITVPDDVVIELIRIENLEIKAERLRKQVEYWKQKDENKKPVLAQLNAEVTQLNDSNRDLLGSKKELEADVIAWQEISKKRFAENKALNKTLTIAENLNQKLEVEVLDKNIEIEDVKNSLKFTGILSWVGWCFFLIAILGMIFL
jgi:hypothetical protein